MPKAKKERRVPDHIAAAKKRGDSQYLREQAEKAARLKKERAQRDFDWRMSRLRQYLHSEEFKEECWQRDQAAKLDTHPID